MRYFNDLRNKVLYLLTKEKYKQNTIAKLLNIDKSTVIIWYNRYKQTGSN